MQRKAGGLVALNRDALGVRGSRRYMVILQPDATDVLSESVNGNARETCVTNDVVGTHDFPDVGQSDRIMPGSPLEVKSTDRDGSNILSDKAACEHRQRAIAFHSI